MRVILWFCVWVSFTIISCNSSKKITAAKDHKADQELQVLKAGNNSNKIVFLTFEVSLADSIRDIYSFSLKNTFFADGTLKKEALQEVRNGQPNYIYYELSAEKEVRYFGKVPNPLKMVYEYPGEGTGMNKVLIKNKKGDIVVRFQNDKGLKYISFYSADPESFILKKIYHALL